MSNNDRIAFRDEHRSGEKRRCKSLGELPELMAGSAASATHRSRPEAKKESQPSLNRNVRRPQLKQGQGGMVVLCLSEKLSFGSISDTLGSPAEAFGHLGDEMILELRDRRCERVVKTETARLVIASE